VDWMSRNPTRDPDVSTLRDEAEAILGRPPRK
jgi:hypothetical protein